MTNLLKQNVILAFTALAQGSIKLTLHCIKWIFLHFDLIATLIALPVKSSHKIKVPFML